MEAALAYADADTGADADEAFVQAADRLKKAAKRYQEERAPDPRRRGGEDALAVIASWLQALEELRA